MGYFNPILYFIKSFIRIFTKKFFWVIIFLLLVLFFWLFFNREVKAVDSNYSFTYDNLADVTAAQQVVGSSIWNNTNYDIFVYYDPNPPHGVSVVYFDTTTLNDNTVYRVNTDLTDTFHGLDVLPFYTVNTTTGSSVNNTASDYHIKTVYNNNLNVYYPIFAPASSPGWGTNLFGNRSTYEIYCHVVRSHFDFVDTSGNIIVQATNPREINPYFITTNQQLESFDFDYLQISGGTTPYEYYFSTLDTTYTPEFKLEYIYQGVTTQIDVSNYVQVFTNTNRWQLNIPYNALTNNVIVRDGESFTYRFTYTMPYLYQKDMIVQGTYNLTSEQESNINADSDKYVQGQIVNQQQQTNNKLDNLDNSINNDNVDDVSGDFSGFSDGLTVQDNSGIDSIFQKLYDAFCTDNVQNVVITIPFVNKTFTIDTTAISSHFPEAVKSIVGLFVWGIIGLWVLKDIRSITNKIAEGSPEDVGSDVKKEVL